LPFSYKYSKIFIKFIGVLVVIAPERGKNGKLHNF